MLVPDNIATAQVYNLRGARFLFGVVYSVSIPFIWNFLVGLGGAAAFYSSWVMFLVGEQVGTIVCQLGPIKKLDRKVSYFVGLVIGSVGVIQVLVSSFLGSKVLFCFGRLALGVAIGACRECEVQYIDDILYAKQGFYTKRAFKLWETFGMIAGGVLSVLVCLVASKSVFYLKGFSLCCYISFLGYIVLFIYGLLNFPEHPLYANIPLGQQTLYPLLGALEVSDHLKVLRRDYIEKYRKEETYSKYSTTGIIVISIAGVCGELAMSFLWSCFLRILFDNFDDRVSTLLFAGVIALRAIAILLTSAFTVRVAYLRTVLFSLLLGCVGWLSLYFSYEIIMYTGLYMAAPLCGISAPLLVFSSEKQYSLVIGYKQADHLQKIFNMSKLLGNVLGPAVFFVFNHSEDYLGITLCVIFFLELTLVLSLWNQCEEHESLVVQKPNYPIRPLKYPHQVRNEISKSILEPKFRIPYD